MRSSIFQRGLVLLCALLSLSVAERARAQEARGALLIVVQDASGGSIAGARLTLAQPGAGFARRARTDSRGEFRFVALPPGTYRLTTEADGFALRTTDAVVGVGAQPTLGVTLVPQAVSASVLVRDRGPSLASQPLETTSSAQKTIITAADLDELPLFARSFANIALLSPFTAPVEPSDPTKARITAVSFGGSSGLNVDLSVDGGDNNDDYIGGFLQNYSPEAMQEFVVRTAQFGADTSRTNGGSVILSTRRGSDDWHGSAAYFYRGDVLNARNALDNPEPDPQQPFSRQNGVGTLGGPLVREKLWFFASFEYVDEDASVAYSAANRAQLNALAQLAVGGLIPGVPSVTVPAAVPVPFRDALFSGRLDWTQSARSQWFLRDALDRNHTENDLVQQAALPSTGATTQSNYYSVLLSNQWQFTPAWLGALTLQASGMHHTKQRNSHLGLALAFPFSANFHTTSGFETFGDNQFATEITAFPVARDQQKYQFRYDVTRSAGRHAARFGVNFIHEPVLRGALASDAERLYAFDFNPTFYLANPAALAAIFACDPVTSTCPNASYFPGGDGTFAQSVRRLGFYAEDSWRVRPSFTLNAGLRYDTTFGLFRASGREQAQNPAVIAVNALGLGGVLGIPPGTPHDYRRAFAPRLGMAYAPGGSATTVLRAGVGLYFNDLTQNGWVDAFTAVNNGNAATPLGPGEQGALIAPNYHTPYALEASAGVEHDFGKNWRLNITYEHQQGVHQYRRYEYVSGATLPGTAPNLSVFRTDNRSRYDGLAIQMQHRFAQRFELTANYVLGKASTWGAVVGELFDYVNGVSDVRNPFGPGDHGPSGEDIRHRFVLAGVLQLPGKFELSTLSQFESARPFTLGTPVDINGDGTDANDRAVVNGVQTSLDQFRGTPFAQVDLRVSRNIALGERVTLRPFAEFFNLSNRANPGNNYVGDMAALPVPVNDLANATAFCLDGPACTQTQPITSLSQLRVPAGALGDFFGPGTTVGIPFAAQIGVKLIF